MLFELLFGGTVMPTSTRSSTAEKGSVKAPVGIKSPSFSPPPSSSILQNTTEEIPILIQRPSVDNTSLGNGSMYLEMLLETYKSQIDMLQIELKSKNDIIHDLLNIIKFQGHTTVVNDAAKCADTSRADLPIDNTNLIDNGFWSIPKKAARYAEADNSTSEVQTSNRFSLLDSEWIKEAEEDQSETRSEKSVQNTPKRNKRNRATRVVTIAGDSMLGGVKKHHFKNLSSQKVYVKCFPGATVDDMNSYMVPSMKHDPEAVVIHAGTNNLSAQKSPLEIAQEIVNLASSLQTDRNEIIISSIIRRGDRFQAKATAVNSHLYQLCVDGNFTYLDNSNIRLEHLQKGGHWGNIHLNDKGTDIFRQNLFDILSI